MNSKTTIAATHVDTDATKFDRIPVKGSRRQVRAMARKIAREPGRVQVWLGWYYAPGAKPLAFEGGRQVRE